MGRAYIPSAGNVCGGLSPKEGPQRGSATLHAEHPGLCRGLWEQERLSLSPCNPAAAFRCTEGTPGRSEPGKLRPREVKGPAEVTRQVWASLPPASFRLQAVRERKRMGSPGRRFSRTRACGKRGRCQHRGWGPSCIPAPCFRQALRLWLLRLQWLPQSC